MRRAGLLFALATMLASSASPAAAHHSPDTCAGNAADLTISSNRAMVRPGDPVLFTVMASNQGAGACDVTATSLAVRLPAADGTATGTLVQLPLADSPGTSRRDTVHGGRQCALHGGGQPKRHLDHRAGGGHRCAPRGRPQQRDGEQDSTTPATQPRLGFTFSAAPLTGFAPVTTTYEFMVSNTSTTRRWTRR